MHIQTDCSIISVVKVRLSRGPVAQLDRATVSGAVCRGFESLLDHMMQGAQESRTLCSLFLYI